MACLRTLEDCFVREFKREIRLIGNKDIYSVPLPEEVKDWYVSGSERYRVWGIDNEYFSGLNDKIVRRVPRGYEVKRRVVDKVNRSYKTDEEGKFLYENYTVPSGSTAIVSATDLGIPYRVYMSPPKGYGYVDFIDKAGKREFIYIIPNDYLYKIHQTALAISVKNMKNYQGAGFVTWDSGVIYIHIIPYNPNGQYIGSKILKTGIGFEDVVKDFHKITDYWEKVGFIPNVKLCSLQTGENLAIKPTVVGYVEYEPVDSLPIGSKEVFGEEEGV